MKWLSLLLLLFSLRITACEPTEVVEITQFCTFLPGVTQWYSFTTEEPTTVSIITAGYGDGKMDLFAGTSCDDMEFIMWDDNSGPFLMPQISLETEVGLMYFVRVYDVEVFEVCIFNCAPLPVELLSFVARPDGTLVMLRWSTASEINNNYFTIYSSTDFKNWEERSRVVGSGHSSTVRYYTYTLVEKTSDKVIYFKLMQTDFNGDTKELAVIPYIGNIKKKKLLKSVTIDGQPIPANYKGIRIKVYDDGTIGKEIVTQ